MYYKVLSILRPVCLTPLRFILTGFIFVVALPKEPRQLKMPGLLNTEVGPKCDWKVRPKYYIKKYIFDHTVALC